MGKKIYNNESYYTWLISLFGYLSGLYTKIANCNVFVTTRCNSRCEMCRSWKMKKIDISLTAIENIAKSRCINKLTDIGLEGGEFLLHPQIDEIMRILKGYNVSIISNGILTERIIEFIKKYHIRKASISLDGSEEYQNCYRMYDSYHKTVKSLELLSKMKDQMIVSVIYTPSPWNTESDYQHVRSLAERLGINFGLGMYFDHNIFEEGPTPEDLNYQKDDYQYPVPFNDFGRMLHKWLLGEIVLPCISKKSRVAVWPGGELPLCFPSGLIVGNLNIQTIDEIMKETNTQKLLHKYASCNRCWVPFNRNIDVEFFLKLRKIVPLNMLRLFWKDLRL